MKKVICDTNVFIKLFNNDVQTIQHLTKIGSNNILIPSISVMELFAGMGNKQ